MWSNFRYVVGRGVRETGQALERVGLRAQEDTAFKSFLNRKPFYKLKGKHPNISANSFIAPNAAVIGNVRVAPESSIWYGVVLRGDSNKISIGAGSSIGDNCVVHVASNKNLSEIPNPTIVGDKVVVEPGCVIHACTLQDNCTIGTGSVVADGSVIGEHSVVEPGSYVPEHTDVPERQVWGGKPARYIRSLTEEEIKANESVSATMQNLGQKHIETQQKLEIQLEDYNDEKTFYHQPASAQKAKE
eukprot:CAMPEP_0117056006 /NCGR_PEP_ID=MMETSP0472-20121206/38854_1 /TAXON_ID=693140 ORGANISM="Tiarina fusus, Strain LIS" /NCGR_SAMPLE_ID=MMETSP0472 /ASSEMBLY_ACC=CAM_ASM_000603 /LENGTH=244 /DNA_ID=CAMNT_0004772279 /DNA_START=1 /DNA_END=735 /DNA_ORIENTATION=+